jgi:undecaprenyl diphosphate synthase
MRLFVTALQREVGKLVENDIRLRIVGERGALDKELQRLIVDAESRTASNDGLHLTLCVSYGGRWDIVQAARAALREGQGEEGGGQALGSVAITEDSLQRHLGLSFAPDPDLLIRTGGEQRISNFMLWQLAYTELHFTDAFWPDFGAAELERAFESFRARERRFGRTSAQVAAPADVPGS